MQLTALIKKELRLYFNSPIAYIFLVAFLSLSAWFFFRGFFLVGQVEMRGFFGLLPWIFLFLIPALTMRLWSEEFRQGTIETLLTSSASIMQTVLAKFIATGVFLSIALLATFILPISLSALGDLDWGTVLVAYLGALFLGLSYTALGLFISSLTQNQIVAFILSVLATFALLIFASPIVTYALPGFLIPFIDFISLGSHYDSIIRGVIDTKDIIYYFSFIFLFIFLNTEVLKQQKTSLRSLTAVATIIVLVIVNLFAYNFSTRFDFTEGKIYTLSASTKNIISTLDTELEIKVFLSEKLPSQVVKTEQSLRDYLDEYKNLSNGNLNIIYTDPAKNPEDAQLAQYLGVPEIQLQVIEKDQQQVRKAYMGLAVLKENENKEELEEGNPNPLANYEKYESLPLIQNLSNFEYDLTSAIMKVSSNETKVIGFLTGHEEHGLAPTRNERAYGAEASARQDYPLRELLEKNYQSTPVQIAEPSEDGVATIEGVDTLVIAGPKIALKDYEVLAVKDFIKKGGNVLMLIDQIDIAHGLQASAMKEDFSALLSDYGVSVQKSLIKDSNHSHATFSQGFFSFSLPYPYWLKVSEVNEDNAITAELDSFVLPWVSPLSITKKSDVEITQLARTSKRYGIEQAQEIQSVPVEALVNTDDDSEEVSEPEMKDELVDRLINLDPQQQFGIPNEKKEPLPLAVIAQKAGEGKVFIMGDSDFINNQFASQFSSNVAFFMNVIDAFTLGDALISIRSKVLADRPIGEVSEAEKNLVKWGNIIFVPLVFVIYGLVRRSLRNARKYS